MNRTGLASLIMALALTVSFVSAYGDEDESWSKTKSQHKKESIDAMAQSTLDRLFAEDGHAKSLFDLSYGYAIFDNLKIMFGVSGGGGSGVAVVKKTGQRVYMKMGSGGLGLGLGGQKSRIIFFFQDQKALEDFVYNGWQGDAGANAVAGTAGANTNAAFTQGIVLYQLTESGLMLKADVSGTKYWVDKKLSHLPANRSASSQGVRSNSGNTDPGRPVRSEVIEPRE